MRTTGLEVGDRVVDFGCGSGEPSLALARYVGPKGQVLGVDVSVPMLEVARRRTRMAQLDNVRFRRGDLAAFRYRGSRFDVAVSRFALMFASDLDTALGNVRDALRRGGRAAFAVWGSLEQNPSIAIRARLRRHFDPGSVPDPETIPHPLRLARPGRLAGLMRRAGFEEVREEGVHAGTAFGSLDDCVRMQSEVAMCDLTTRSRPPGVERCAVASGAGSAACASAASCGSPVSRRWSQAGARASFIALENKERYTPIRRGPPQLPMVALSGYLSVCLAQRGAFLPRCRWPVRRHR